MTSLEQLISTLKKVDKVNFKSESERVQAQNAILVALSRVQTPWDVAQQHIWGDPITTTIVKILVDVDLWKKWVEVGGKPSTTSELAGLVNVDPLLLKRLLRELAGQNLLEESEDGNVYSLTDFGRELGATSLSSLYDVLYGMNQPCFSNFPKFLSETNYKNPVDPEATNGHSWLGESFFSWLPKNPHIAKSFNETMAVFAANKAPWITIYSTDSIVAASKPGHALVVDVAGGIGHDIEKFRAKHPDSPAGSLILQDLDTVIQAAQVKSPIRTQAIDILQGQPEKGARVYYLHNVLHDWPDSQCVDILTHIAAAMEYGYSRVLIHENIILPKNSHPRSTVMDVVMLAFFSAAEREENAWASIAENAGLKITKVWTSPETIESIIELELAS